MATAGHVIAGKYELVRVLGSGSMGEVWIAHHLTLGEDVALKLLTPEPSDCAEDPSTATARFRFEAQVAARLSRKTRHIVRVTDHGEEDGLAYLVMELLEGETLERRLTRGRVALDEVPRLAAQIARALTEAHAANVIHRDLKPANVFLASDEDGAMLVKLLDFGIARATQTHRAPAVFSTGRGLVFGTPGYMSPEQVNPSSKLDGRCDLWALATVVYEMLTGEMPVTGSSGAEFFANLVAGRVIPVHERDPGLPAGLASFFDRAFARNIDERYSSASELAAALAQAIDGCAVPGDARAIGGRTLPITFPMRFRRGRLPVETSPGVAPAGPMRGRSGSVAVVAGVLGLVAAAGASLVLRSTSASRGEPGTSAFRFARTASEETADRVAAPVVLEELESHALTLQAATTAPRAAVTPTAALRASGVEPRTPRPAAGDRAGRLPPPLDAPVPTVTPAQVAPSRSNPVDRSAVL